MREDARSSSWLDARIRSNAPCEQTIYNAVQVAINMAILYEPFLPRTAQRLRARLGFAASWQFSSIPAGTVLIGPMAQGS